ncbi:MAG TPA: hypothetical protein DEA62_04980 [Coxiellaceae bacterium]|nr:hypothetical protein [Coxiellaceae bacterium]
MKKILLTGASGFFGRSVIDSLKHNSDNFECFCVYHSKPLKTSEKKFHWMQCDLLNKEKTEQLINNVKPSHLVHLAWHVPPQKFWTAEENIDWLHASINLFQTFGKNDGQVFVGAGTLAEYDWSSGTIDEATTPLKPNTLYGQCKKSLCDVLISLRNTHYPQIKIIWPRIGYFFGPDEPKEKIMSKLIYSIQNELPIDLASHNFIRPYAHVKYFGEIMHKLLINDGIGDAVFNMSCSNSYSLKEIVDFIQTKLNKNTRENLNNYNAYPSLPISLSVQTGYLKNIPGLEIADSFFDDLETMMGNNNEGF